MPTGDLHEQYFDERDLDSDRSDDEDRERKDPYDIEYEEQVKKMSHLFNSYFDNVETLQNKSKNKNSRIALTSAVKKPI